MKATGMIRRIDDVGRVVIPKEIRSSMGMTSGQALEIFLDNNELIFKKYESVRNAMEAVEHLERYIAGEDAIAPQMKSRLTEKAVEMKRLLEAGNEGI